MLLASVQRTIISLFGNAASTVVALAARLALLPACAFQSKPRSSDLEAPLLSPNDDSAEEFRERFISLLDDETNRLRTRVGLVPNYFMTRGEDTERLFESRKSFLHKTSEKIFKTFHRDDFREDVALRNFENLFEKVDEAVAFNSARLEPLFREELNRPKYKYGDTLLTSLVRKRHLRLLRLLLLHAGKYLDFEQSNRQGFRAIDLAIDRLEVEMVYLLLLYGAQISSRKRTKKSLGVGEWVGYDLLQNLDTGRWLHRRSEEAIMDHGSQIIKAPLSNKLIEWSQGLQPITNEDLELIGKIPRLFALVLADGCDAITSHEAFATLIRHLKNLHDRYANATADMGRERAILPKHFNEPRLCTDLYGLLGKHGCIVSEFRVAGRTIFFKSLDGKEIALKMSKKAENERVPHPLAKEAEMNTFMKAFKQKYGLISDFPETLELIRVTTVPTTLREAIASQESAGYHPFALARDGTNDGVIMLLYRPPDGYGVYANDPSIGIETCVNGIKKAAFDAAVLARHGMYHAALVDIQHDSSREERPHLWSFESFLTRFRGGA